MIRLEIIIAVNDVEKSSEWYRELLNCESKHGGETFGILADTDDTVILCLHKWGDHHHATLTDSKIQAGNGLILYFRVSNFDEIWKNANKLQAKIEEQPHLNQNSGKEEFSVRDIDGYFVSITS